MNKEELTHFPAITLRACLADRRGEKGALAPHRTTFHPHRVRLAVRPGSIKAAVRVRCGSGR